MLPLAVFLFGAVLGVAFRVWVLVPASLAALIPAGLTGVASDSFPEAVMQFVWLIAALQGGYLLGLLSRLIMFSKPAPETEVGKAAADEAHVKSVI